MFKQTQVNGGSREQPAGEDSDEFSNLAHCLNRRAAISFYRAGTDMGKRKLLQRLMLAIKFL